MFASLFRHTGDIVSEIIVSEKIDITYSEHAYFFIKLINHKKYVK